MICRVCGGVSPNFRFRSLLCRPMVQSDSQLINVQSKAVKSPYSEKYVRGYVFNFVFESHLSENDTWVREW